MTLCPRCNVHDIDPDSKEGWCTKCTGVFAHKSGPTPQRLLELIEQQTSYVLGCEQAVLFAQTQADEHRGTALYSVALRLLDIAKENRDYAQKDLSRLKGETRD